MKLGWHLPGSALHSLSWSQAAHREGVNQSVSEKCISKNLSELVYALRPYPYPNSVESKPAPAMKRHQCIPNPPRKDASKRPANKTGPSLKLFPPVKRRESIPASAKLRPIGRQVRVRGQLVPAIALTVVRTSQVALAKLLAEAFLCRRTCHRGHAHDHCSPRVSRALFSLKQRQDSLCQVYSRMRPLTASGMCVRVNQSRIRS